MSPKPQTPKIDIKYYKIIINAERYQRGFQCGVTLTDL